LAEIQVALVELKRKRNEMSQSMPSKHADVYFKYILVATSSIGFKSGDLHIEIKTFFKKYSLGLPQAT
jgi:hypothetical protein